MSQNQLSDDAKHLIKEYIITLLVPIAGVSSIITFVLGYIIKDVAQQYAIADATKSTYSSVLDAANKANEALNRAHDQTKLASDLGDSAKKANNDAQGLLEKAKTTLAETESLRSSLAATIDTNKALAQSAEIISSAKQAAISYVGQLNKDGALTGPVLQSISPRLEKIDSDIKNLEQVSRLLKNVPINLDKFKTVTKNSREIPCTTPWDAGGVSAYCPANTIRVGGGCSYTCLNLDHAISVPTGDDGWNCRAISHDDGGRTYSAVAVCLGVGS